MWKPPTLKSLGLPTQARKCLKSYVEVAEIMGISRSRVYQLENRALAKIRLAIQREAAAKGISVRDWLYGDE